MDRAAPSPLGAALRQFEATEANIAKLERISKEIGELSPDTLAFGSDTVYEQRCREYEAIVIDGWKIKHLPLDLNDIGQIGLDAQEIGEISAVISVDEAIEAPARDLAEYRFRFEQKRRELVREAVLELVDHVDEALRILEPLTEEHDLAVGAVASEEIRND